MWLNENDALIGSTGFVGANLLADAGGVASFHSKNIESIKHRHFDQIVCCGAPGVKWKANAEPAHDAAQIGLLMDCLKSVTANRFVLISTTDVYGGRIGDETETPIPGDQYGTHRLQLERFVRRQFSHHQILRLPGLFGRGLRKNVLYDLIHCHRLEYVQPKSSFQWFYLARIADFKDHPGELVNIATEPILTELILDRFFPDLSGGGIDPIVRYDVQTIHQPSGYFLQATAVLEDLRKFLQD